MFKKPILASLLATLTLPIAVQGASIDILNVSYDPTRELYKDINGKFAAAWKTTRGDTVTIRQSHGGSGKQARSVIDGLAADVVTLALASDIDAIAANGKLLPADWQQRLPQNSSPYTSTIVLLVRKDNPKGIKDWGDLAKPGVSVVTPNPKTSGGARWNYLAAYAWALKQYGNDDVRARDYIGKLYRNAPILDTGARGSMTTFAQRGIGDVFISWENEAFLALEEFGRDKFQIIVPSLSILAEPPVALVDKVVDKRGTRKVAEAYLNFLYTEEAQELIAQHHYRPANGKIAARYQNKFPKLALVTIADFGGWGKVQPEHFSEGGVFDQIYQK